MPLYPARSVMMAFAVVVVVDVVVVVVAGVVLVVVVVVRRPPRRSCVWERSTHLMILSSTRLMILRL